MPSDDKHADPRPVSRSELDANSQVRGLDTIRLARALRMALNPWMLCAFPVRLLVHFP